MNIKLTLISILAFSFFHICCEYNSISSQNLSDSVPPPTPTPSVSVQFDNEPPPPPKPPANLTYSKHKMRWIDKDLIDAVNENDKKKVEDLLQQGANSNTIKWQDPRRELYGGTVLDIAVWRGNLDIATLLIKYGANVEKSVVKSDESSSSLGTAIFRNDIPMINLLLDNGANISEAFFTCTSEEKTIALLVKRGADIDAPFRGNHSALMIEAGGNDYKKVELLLKYGANVNFRDADGNTALDFVKKGEKGEKMRELLMKHGAKEKNIQ